MHPGCPHCNPPPTRLFHLCMPSAKKQTHLLGCLVGDEPDPRPHREAGGQKVAILGWSWYQRSQPPSSFDCQSLRQPALLLLALLGWASRLSPALGLWLSVDAPVPSNLPAAWGMCPWQILGTAPIWAVAISGQWQRPTHELKARPHTPAHDSLNRALVKIHRACHVVVVPFVSETVQTFTRPLGRTLLQRVRLCRLFSMHTPLAEIGSRSATT